MSRSLPELIPLVCSRCGQALEADPPGQALLPCAPCGRLWEPRFEGLAERGVATASATSSLVPPADSRFLPVWVFPADVRVDAKRSDAAGRTPGRTWETVRRRAPSGLASLYVPAFRRQKGVVGRLGRTLVEAQPAISAVPGLPAVAGGRSGDVSPVMLSEADARVVAHFVYLAVEVGGTPDLRGIDYELALGPASLVFLPAAVDPRSVRDLNWRFLLREFDGLVV